MNTALLDALRRHLARSDAPINEATVTSAVRRTETVPLSAGAFLGHAYRLSGDLIGAGPLQSVLDDEEVTDVLVNGPERVWIDRGRGLELSPIRFRDATEVRALAARLASMCGRRLDDANPCVDVSLSDGTRLHAVLPPIAVDGPYLSLRSHRVRQFDVEELKARGTVTEVCADILREIIQARTPFLVSGGTGTGKTTMLGALLQEAASVDRIVLVEDASELVVNHPHVARLAVRAANVENVGAIDMRTLVRQALRMRPDRIIIGECRGAEIVELLTALNTGHDGGAGTIHCNTASDVPARLEALALPHGIPRQGLHALIVAALRVIIHMRRQDGVRVVDEIGIIAKSSDGLHVNPVWNRVDDVPPELGFLDRERGEATQP